MNRMVSLSDNSSSDDEDSLELQRLKDAAVTLEPDDGDLHSSPKFSTQSNLSKAVTSDTKVIQPRRSLRPSLRPKQTYSEDYNELQTTPGFQTHVAKKLSDILDKELEFSESAADECSQKKKSSKSGIRLLSSSKKFLKLNPNVDILKTTTDSNSKSHFKVANSRDDKSASSASRKRGKPKCNKQTNSSSSDSSEDERISEAAVSFGDVKAKDELLSTYAISRPPILIIRPNDNGRERATESNNQKEETNMGENLAKKKKKNKKKRRREREEKTLEEEG